MRKVHASFDDEDQYRDTERFANEFLSQSSKANLCMVNSKHNLRENCHTGDAWKGVFFQRKYFM